MGKLFVTHNPTNQCNFTNYLDSDYSAIAFSFYYLASWWIKRNGNFQSEFTIYRPWPTWKQLFFMALRGWVPKLFNAIVVCMCFTIPWTKAYLLGVSYNFPASSTLFPMPTARTSQWSVWLYIFYLALGTLPKRDFRKVYLSFTYLIKRLMLIR